ncbi:oxygen-independent coproporphyrinogen III oxidase [Salinispirillum sp. LH 10-3-1]|uniref:Coproporphyrinogen-III oxidase n=1 Tax=Salinispirillum sp. LH 10-3-1 TaxID=2952525 RepID=A0AB38YDP4_9GAMM
MALADILWKPDTIARYNVSGPRYTSYPTALQFGPISHTALPDALALGEHNAPLSLYVHIPFCQHLCYYCACTKVVTRDQSKADRYLDALEYEMQRLAPMVRHRPVRQLHWGGGTPTFLSTEQTARLCQMLSQNFKLEPNDQKREFSIEIDPRVTSLEQLEQLRSWGFNRLSMGIQDFHKPTQEAVHRIQSLEMVTEQVEKIRALGFHGISFDLIYGLPHQSLTSMKRTLEQVIALAPNRIACYSYAHLPERFAAQKRILASDLPTPETKVELLHTIVQQLQTAGYRYIGMDHFALPDDGLVKAHENGTLQRNFQGYSTHGNTDLLGLGVSSISAIQDIYLQNHADLDVYQDTAQSMVPTYRGYRMHEDDRIRRRIIMDIACQGYVNFAYMCDEFAFDFQAYFARELEALIPLAEDGLIVLTEDDLTVTEIGRLLLRPICMVFDAYLPSHGQTRYSRVI